MASTLTHRALQHHASCFSMRSTLQSTRYPWKDEAYHDDGLTPRALSIRRPHLREKVPCPTRQYTTQSQTTDESQDSTPRGPLRVINPDIDHDYHDHRRAAIYVLSPAQQALQRVITSQRSVSTQSSQSRLSSLGSNIVATVRRHKPRRNISVISTKTNSADNPLRAPPGSMSDTESHSVDSLSRSVSLNSNKSSIAEPQTAPRSVIAPFAHIEPVRISPLECLTPGGIAAAKLELQSFTAIYAPDEFHYSPAVTVWGVVTVKCVNFLDGVLVNNHDGNDSATNRTQLALRSHGQIANLALEVTPPESFDVVCVLGRLQHRQVLMGSTWSVIFKLQPQKKLSVSRIPQRVESHSPDVFSGAGGLWSANRTNRSQYKSENDKLMDEVEKMLMPEADLIAQVQYSHNLFPTSTTMQESNICPIKAITESERRHRQFYEQRGQPWRQQRGTSALTTSNDLDRDLETANAICAVLREGIGANWPKDAKSSIKYIRISPNDALQLLYDFREAAGVTLPQDVTEEMDRLKCAYQQLRKEKQERSFTRKSLKVVYEMRRFARRAVPASSTFSGRYNHNALSITESTQHLYPGRNTPENHYTASSASACQPQDNIATLKDITNDASRRRGVARFIDTLPIVGRRKNARTDITEKEPDLEKGVREEDHEIRAIWKKVRIISGTSSTMSDDMERINESNLGGPPWM